MNNKNARYVHKKNLMSYIGPPYLQSLSLPTRGSITFEMASLQHLSLTIYIDFGFHKQSIPFSSSFPSLSLFCVSYLGPAAAHFIHPIHIST